jgi:large subunit ribosomal protein L4
MSNKVKNQQKQTSVRQSLSIKDIDVQQPETPVSSQAFAVCIRARLQNWRQGTVACKGRSDVARSNKKPWKQKGTGRARAGSPRSPLWRGGGVTFGPQARTKILSISQTHNRMVMNHLLFDYLKQDKVHYLDWILEGDKPRTTAAYTVLKNAELANKKITLFVPATDALVYASFANIPHVRILFFDQPNVYDLADSDCWVFLKKDMDSFKEMVSKWS